ncbi:other ulk ulk protein kinase [Moniliophthora roreri MCA 2997]|uniref:non-specific serine/threonine protein kinase n=1 Tax=Moniliophthora roreri (strain MCA 2997) TaxID=1381753 RepID=V2WY07_MONRO|nr:other ulk ulk protein kinase [Moniliophthora roreri MCA 2997]
MSPATPSRTSSSTGRSKRERDEEHDVGPYVLGSEIGKGSFATVYKGYHEESRKPVAIKTVKRDKLTAKLFENLQSEIQILKLLSNRHITKLIDIVRAESYIYLVMEYCSGGDLTNYIKKRGRVDTLEYIPSPGAAPQYYPHPRTGGLDEIVVRSFLRQLARALKFLRNRDLIHRDIKPQNLLLSPASPEELARGHPLGVPILKVADFGFARSLPNAMMAETLCGSPLYMAPEILGYKKYDAKADLWSVGAVLYEMSVGKPPFRAQNHIELLKKIEHSKGIKFPDEDPNSTSAKSGGGGSEALPVPNDIKKLIRMLLKQKPVERASFEDFFGSTALAKSKFPRPREEPRQQDSIRSNSTAEQKSWTEGRPPTPEAHKVIPPEVLDENAMIPPSRFNFRRLSSLGGADGTPPRVEKPLPEEKPSAIERKPSAAAPRLTPSTEASVIPGETEEDGLLRREYVLVDNTRAVEFNKAIDELNTLPRRPLQDRRVPPSPSMDDFPYDYPLPPNIPIINNNGGNNQNATTNNMTFPPPPNAAPAPPLSSSPSSMASRAASNALHRAISLASKKLFGTSNPAGARRQASTSSLKDVHVPPHHGDTSIPSSPRRPQIITLDAERQDDPLEDKMLRELEELAQKTDVLTHWADEMYEYVKAVPQKPLADPAKFTKREGEADKLARKRKNADMEAEYNAVTCVAVYMLLMSFSQKGVDVLRNYQEHMKMRHPDGDFVVSEGFDNALTWFKDHFIKCNDRAALVKTWLPAQYDGPKSWLDQLVYDRALLLSRTAARKELLDQASTPDECEKLYEESLWCLYALQDDLLQTGNPFMDEDRATIATWIKRTKLRLIRCRARMSMNDRDRLNDARADVNLVDAARVPAPWEPTPPRTSS